MSNLTEPFFPIATNPESNTEVSVLTAFFAFLGELAASAAICSVHFLAVFSAFSVLGFGIHVLSLAGVA